LIHRGKEKKTGSGEDRPRESEADERAGLAVKAKKGSPNIGKIHPEKESSLRGKKKTRAGRLVNS